MMEFAFFPGCSIPSGFPQYERLLLRVLDRLGVSVRYLDGMTCCPAPMTFDIIDEDMFYLLGARNLSLAQEMGLDILSPCNGCTMTLSRVNKKLRTDENMRGRVNAVLKEVNREYKGSIGVRSLLRALYEDVTPDKIAQNVKTPLTGLKVAVHYGCHAYEELEDYCGLRKPRVLEKLCEALGAEIVEYDSQNECCLVFANPVDRDYSLESVHRKHMDLVRAKADCLVVICASCFSQYDSSQEILSWIDKIEESRQIPVFLYPELLALAIGIDQSEIGFEQHKVSPLELLARLGFR